MVIIFQISLSVGEKNRVNVTFVCNYILEKAFLLEDSHCNTNKVRANEDGARIKLLKEFQFHIFSKRIIPVHHIHIRKMASLQGSIFRFKKTVALRAENPNCCMHVTMNDVK